MTKQKVIRKHDDKKTRKKGTLDQKHTEKIHTFEKMSNSLPDKKEKLRNMEEELDILAQTSPNKNDSQIIHRKAQLVNNINKIRDEIDAIENCNDSLNYISKTFPILIDYYDNNQENLDKVDEEFNNDLPETIGKKNILSYFFKDTKKEIENSSENIKDDVIKNKFNRATLYDNYLNAIDFNYAKTPKIKNSFCKNSECGGEVLVSYNDGYLVCKECGLSEPILVAVDKPNYKEPTQDSGTYAYKRINHLTEILSQLQAKESTDIPQKVYESILKELKKRKINKDDLDIFRLRRILKKLNLRKYYEHVPHILQIINGKEPPNFTRKDEMMIKKMFKDIQKPFAIYCPENRKNFLNYSYVLHKFCELLSLDKYISYFPLLKNHKKLRQHDQMWKNICEYMRWKYYKSI